HARIRRGRGARRTRRWWLHHGSFSRGVRARFAGANRRRLHAAVVGRKAYPGRAATGAGAERAPMSDQPGAAGRAFVALQHLLPQHGISRLVLQATRSRAPAFKNALIRLFVRAFKPDMADAVE